MCCCCQKTQGKGKATCVTTHSIAFWYLKDKVNYPRSTTKITVPTTQRDSDYKATLMRAKSTARGWATFVISPTHSQNSRWENLTLEQLNFHSGTPAEPASPQQCWLLWNAASECLQAAPSPSATPVPLFPADYPRIYFQGRAVLRQNRLCAQQLKRGRMKDTHQTGLCSLPRTRQSLGTSELEALVHSFFTPNKHLSLQ